MRNMDLYTTLLTLKYFTLCEIYGLTPDQCLSIQEYEFTVSDEKVEYLETWSNTYRTKGYRKWDLKKYNLHFNKLNQLINNQNGK
jgi:hypothetical protein